jgi:hypothetical protein
MARFSVAAVCDRQIENEPGPHREPLQVVAAVYDRRASPALTERRHRKANPHCFPKIVCLLLFLFPLFLSAAPKKDAIPPVDPSVVYDASVKVLRGGTCEVPLRAISPQGYDVKFEILSQPRSGSLSGPQRNSKSSVSYFYTHDGKKNSFQDSFRFKCKSGPQKAWGYAKATILVEEPPARFAADVSALDFGSVFLGESRTLPVRIKNAGGGRLQGRLKVSPPWSFAGPVDITLSEGETQKILVTFAPLSTDTQRGSLVFEYGSKPFPEITLEGVGESRFEVPEKAAFDPRVGANELRIPITNHTAAPLPISIHCPPPLEAHDSITLAPESTGELLLKLPARPFAEKNSLVTLSDGSATRDIRIQLPPPPSLLQWEINGKKQLGFKSPGRIDPLSATLRNTGSTTASAVLRVSGDGMSLAPDQAANLTIAPGETATVNAAWKFPEMPGPVEVVLVAQTDGLPPVQISWEAEVQTISAEPAPSPSPSPTPGASPPPTPIVHGPHESAAILNLLPQGISYQLEPHWNSCTAILTWQYLGPEPVEFSIARPELTRKNLLDKNPFQKSIPLPASVPTPVPKILWVPIDSRKADITKLPDGRWQARVPGLTPGYHPVGIIAKVKGHDREGFVEFPVSVGNIPQSDLFSWGMYAFVLLCATYLLRNKIRSLFG